MEKREVRIEEWEVIFNSEDGSRKLRGNVYGHVNFTDGTEVVTSKIIKDDSIENYRIETKNTIYILGKERK